MAVIIGIKIASDRMKSLPTIFVKLRTSGKFTSESEERHSFDHTSKELA